MFVLRRTAPAGAATTAGDTNMSAAGAANFMPSHTVAATGRGQPPLATNWRQRRRKRLTTLSGPFLVIFVALAAQPARRWPECAALRIINLDLPRTALQGATIQLGCVYSLTASPTTRLKRSPNGPVGDSLRTEQPPAGSRDVDLRANLKSIGELSAGQTADDIDGHRRSRSWRHGRQVSAPSEVLYAIKWYKDEREFYRYIAQDWPHKQTLPLDGLHVDIEKSNNQTVVLRNVSVKTSGLFRCEVSTDAPSFVTKSIERKMLVYSLPDGGPMIERSPLKRQQHFRHSIGDQIELSCKSRESKPAARIDWILNDWLNLSSSTPLDSVGRPLFQVTGRQLVRLPTSTLGMAANSPQLGASGGPTGDLRDLSVGLDYTPAVATILQMPVHRYTTFELQENQTDQTLAARPVDSPASSVVTLAANYRDQLLESSLSTLNFSVTANLIQLLSSVAKTPKSQRLNLPSHKLINTQGNAQATSKWRRTNATNSLRPPGLPGNNGPDQSRLFNLKIKCAARVLHLSLSDEIRLKLVNSSKEADQQSRAGSTQDDLDAQLQKQQSLVIEGNSGGIGFFQNSKRVDWRIVLLLSQLFITYVMV